MQQKEVERKRKKLDTDTKILSPLEIYQLDAEKLGMLAITAPSIQKK